MSKTIRSIDPKLRTELWTSWASLLRSYAAAHGLNSAYQAVIEVSADEINLRVSDQWLRFTPTEMQRSNGAPSPFALTEDGNVRLGDQPAEEMDFAAEHLAREMLNPAVQK